MPLRFLKTNNQRKAWPKRGPRGWLCGSDSCVLQRRACASLLRRNVGRALQSGAA